MVAMSGVTPTLAVRSGCSFLDSHQFPTSVEPFTPVMRDTPSPRPPAYATTMLEKKCQKNPIFTNLKKRFEHIELPAKILDYFLRSNKSNINQCESRHTANPPKPMRMHTTILIWTKLLQAFWSALRELMFEPAQVSFGFANKSNFWKKVTTYSNTLFKFVRVLQVNALHVHPILLSGLIDRDSKKGVVISKWFNFEHNPFCVESGVAVLGTTTFGVLPKKVKFFDHRANINFPRADQFGNFVPHKLFFVRDQNSRSWFVSTPSTGSGM